MISMFFERMVVLPPLVDFGYFLNKFKPYLAPSMRAS